MIFENLPGEEFEFVTDAYLVSNYGRMYSIKKKYFLTGKITPFGYREYITSICRKNKRYFAHRLVAFNFLPPPKPGQTMVNHIDSNKLNNRVENLEWVTPKENVHHYHANNPKAKNSLNNIIGIAFRGEESGMSKLTNKDVKFIRESNLNGYRLSKILNVTPSTVYNVLKNISWKHVK